MVIQQQTTLNIARNGERAIVSLLREHRDVPTSNLTPRELAVLSLVADGRADKEIGFALRISGHTASRHVKHIIAKMDARSRTEAAVRAVRAGLLE